MECPSCGRVSLKGKLFCAECGTALPVAVQCPACASESPLESRFCADCGMALVAGQQQSADLHPTPADADAERRQVTVLFCDLVGATPLSRRLDPEELRSVIRGYQTCVDGVVRRYDGHTARYVAAGC